MATVNANPPINTQINPPLRRWNTLQVLKGSRVVLILLDALLVIAVAVATRVHRDAMQTVGVDSAPSIIAAQHIKAALADMDANAANELLGAAGATPQAVAAYESRRVEASQALIAAAENITYGDSERTPILAIQLGLGSYERIVQKAHDLHDNNAAATIATYRQAAELMNTTLLPAADALDRANNQILERTYRSQSTRSFAARAFVLLAGLVALFALAGVQIYMSGHMRRTLNPALLAATLLTLILTVYAWQAMESEGRLLRIAKEDAFTSIHALWQARAVAYQANGDESRFLLDSAHAKEHENAFIAKSESLARLPAGLNRVQVLTALRHEEHVPGFSGFLADELNNITFPGEREAAIRSFTTWQGYLDVDASIRQLQQKGQTRQAIELCLGAAQGQSNWAFDQFDRALLATLEINQTEFHTSVESGLSALRGLEIKALIVAVLIAVLAFLGLAPRIREYQ